MKNIEKDWCLLATAAANMRGFPPEVVAKTFTALMNIAEHLGVDTEQ